MLRSRLYTEDGFGGENVGIATRAAGRLTQFVRSVRRTSFILRRELFGWPVILFLSFHVFHTVIAFILMWLEEKNRLQRVFHFKDFAEAFAFMTEVAFHAEKQNHHPSWTNVWNSVEIQLTTHDAGNIVTDKDRKLAATIDKIYGKYR